MNSSSQTYGHTRWWTPAISQIFATTPKSAPKLFYPELLNFARLPAIKRVIDPQLSSKGRWTPTSFLTSRSKQFDVATLQLTGWSTRVRWDNPIASHKRSEDGGVLSGKFYNKIIFSYLYVLVSLYERQLTFLSMIWVLTWIFAFRMKFIHDVKMCFFVKLFQALTCRLNRKVSISFLVRLILYAQLVDTL